MRVIAEGEAVIIMTIPSPFEIVNIMTDPTTPMIENELGTVLSQRISSLRRAQRLSLDALAARTGLSKGTVVAIEHGKANPSIGSLCRLAAAFSVSVTDLLDVPTAEESDAPIVRVEPRVLWQTERGSEARLDASTSGNTMFEIWSWKIVPGDAHTSDAHSPGTLELISVKTGVLQLTVGEESMLLQAGEAARIMADQSHCYAPSGQQPVSFSMAVLERAKSASEGAVTSKASADHKKS
jgi:transcriptional regulator with XRE-family HTH domain